MRIVLQRVKRAQVTVDGIRVGTIGKGIMVLLGIHHNDTIADADFLVQKCCGLRIFSDEHGRMNRSLEDIKGEVLVVSQFTLYGDCRKGRRPSFTEAAPPQKGKELYDYFIGKISRRSLSVQTGIFGAMMEVELVNDGPVTLVIDR